MADKKNVKKDSKDAKKKSISPDDAKGVAGGPSMPSPNRFRVQPGSGS